MVCHYISIVIEIVVQIYFVSQADEFLIKSLFHLQHYARFFNRPLEI
jgi:hypothetical protein